MRAREKGYRMSKRNSGNNPEEKTDLRIRRTKKSIRDAFFELIDENGFDSVTVKDITDRALISRNTFYLHYEDKFDLLNKISNELMRKVYWDESGQNCTPRFVYPYHHGSPSIE